MHMAGGAAASYSQRKRSSGHGASAAHASYCCCLCCQGFRGSQDALQPKCNSTFDWPAQKEPKPFLAPEPAGMTRSTLKRTVLDSGLRTQAGEQKGACMSHILVPAPRCGCRRQAACRQMARGREMQRLFREMHRNNWLSKCGPGKPSCSAKAGGCNIVRVVAGPGHQSLTGTGQ